MIQYRLLFYIYDTEGETPYVPVYEDKVELDVTSFRSIADRRALHRLGNIISDGLVPEHIGSTVLEKRAIAAIKAAAVPPATLPKDVDEANLEIETFTDTPDAIL